MLEMDVGGMAQREREDSVAQAVGQWVLSKSAGSEVRES
jgi:hypothetical protein